MSHLGRRSKNGQLQAGFTLIELILAMALFSFVLLIITTGFVNILHLYESGVAMGATQQNARFGLDDIVSEGHSAYQTTVIGTTPDQQICLYEPGAMVQYYIGANSGLYKDSLPSGTNCNLLSAGGQVISSSDTMVVQMVASALPALYTPTQPQTLNLTLAIAPSDAISQVTFVNGAPQCPLGIGSQFCSITLLNSTVSLQGTHP